MYNFFLYLHFLLILFAMLNLDGDGRDVPLHLALVLDKGGQLPVLSIQVNLDLSLGAPQLVQGLLAPPQDYDN